MVDRKIQLRRQPRVRSCKSQYEFEFHLEHVTDEFILGVLLEINVDADAAIPYHYKEHCMQSNECRHWCILDNLH